MPDPILVKREAAIATVVLNNPEKLNALSFAMWMRLGEAMRENGVPGIAHNAAMQCRLVCILCRSGLEYRRPLSSQP